MPCFGAHMSAAGEPKMALDEAASFGMQACQLFTKSNRQWRAADLPEEAVRRFHAARREHRIESAVAHAAYLLNLATKDEALRQKSADALFIEMQRAERLGLEYLVVHPGAASDDDVEAALALAAETVDAVHRQLGPTRVMLLLETTAGQGRTIGYRLEELAAITQRMKSADRIGYCLDTCHVFAAGYPISTKKDYTSLLASFDKLLGLERLRVFHLNDSVKPLGSRVDRHAHLGQGEIGLQAFRLLVTDQRFADRPMILETPKGEEKGVSWDAVNLRVLRQLVDGKTISHGASRRQP